MIRRNSAGILLALFVMMIASLLARLIPLLGAPALALLLGIVIGNSPLRATLNTPLFSGGTRFAEGRFLEYSIILLGATLSIEAMVALKLSGLLFILCTLIVTITAALSIGRWLKFPLTTTLLMAAGNGVCGSSAIAATAPAIDASDEERGLVITIVNLAGTVMMFLLPLLVWLLFRDEPLQSAALMGGVLQSVGQVVGGASMVDASIVDFALLFKILRILMLVPIVLLFTHLATQKRGAKKINERGVPLLKRVPWYIYGFLITALLNTLHLLPEGLDPILTFLRQNLEITALAAIGLRLNLQSLKAQGIAFTQYSLLLGGIQIGGAILLIMLLL